MGKDQRPGFRETQAVSKATKPAGHRQGFKVNEFVVYPAHGVGQIVAIEEQEVAGFKLELFVISFSKDKMTLRVPTSKVTAVGMRKISDPEAANRSLEILTGRARIKRTMWSRRAQEYETKINSGDINAIAEVVRDLYRSDAQPEQSYSERQLYEAALRSNGARNRGGAKTSEIDALEAVETQLQKGHGRSGKTPGGGKASRSILRSRRPLAESFLPSGSLSDLIVDAELARGSRARRRGAGRRHGIMPSVDRRLPKGRPGDKAGVIGSEEHDAARDFLGFPKPPGWDLGENLTVEDFLTHSLDHFGSDVARTDRVDCHPLVGVFQGQRLGEADVARLDAE